MAIKLIDSFPELVKEWDVIKNNNLNVFEVNKGTRKKVWWICSKKHSYQCRIDARTGRGHGCPYCNRYKKQNFLDITHPDLAVEWHPKNILKPSEVTAGVHKNVWWFGKCGHEWEAYVHNRSKPIKPSGCPFCTNRKTGIDNNLSAKNPDIAAQWHPIKNGVLKPDKINHKSYKEAWWLGLCGHEWKCKIHSRTRTRRPTHCPACFDSKGEAEVERNLIKMGAKYAKQVRYVDCRSKKPLPFDFCVYLEKQVILIEYQGKQHYEPVDFGGDFKKTFDNILLRDTIKRNWCVANNIELLIIPYMEFNHIGQILESNLKDRYHAETD